MLQPGLDDGVSKKNDTPWVSKNFMVNSSCSLYNSGFFGRCITLHFSIKKKTPPKSQISGFRLPQGRVDPARVLPGDDHHGIDRQKLVALVEGLQIWEIPRGIDTAPFQRWRSEMKK